MDAIEVFADVRCPFAHVGIRRVHEQRVAAGAPPLRVRAWWLPLPDGPSHKTGPGHRGADRGLRGAVR